MLEVVGVVAFEIGLAIGKEAAPQAVHAPLGEGADGLLLAGLEPTVPFAFFLAVHVRAFL